MSRTLVGFACGLVLCVQVWPLAAVGEDRAARGIWPDPDWASDTASVAISRAAEIKALEDYAFTLTGTDDQRLGIRTDSVVIVHAGKIIYERYARGYDASKRHLAWSVSKSITNAVVGAAVNAGALSLDDSICKWLPTVRKDNCNLTVRHFLEFSSGLDWQETYEGQSNQMSSVLAMLYGEGRHDMASFVANHDRRDEPGTACEYSTGDTMVLAAVADAATRPTYGPEFAWKALFDPIGMKSVTWERDPAGHPLGGAYVYATPRDFARFGYLFLSDGRWKGTRILPEGWVHDSVQVNDAYRKKSATFTA